MKYLSILNVFVMAAVLTNAQSAGKQSKTPAQARKPASQVRGGGQYHGSRDTTPGSPMGTGGAGGNEMSGSQTGSASEVAIQAGKENLPPDQAGSRESTAKKANTKKKVARHKNRRM